MYENEQNPVRLCTMNILEIEGYFTITGRKNTRSTFMFGGLYL